MLLDVEINQHIVSYGLEIGSNEESVSEIQSECLSLGDRKLFEFDGDTARLFDADGTEATDWQYRRCASSLPPSSEYHFATIQRDFLDVMDRLIVLAPQPSIMRSITRQENSILEFDASNFADWFRHEIQENFGQILGFFKAINATTKRIESLRFTSSENGPRTLVAHCSHMNTDYELEFSQLSSGERCLVLLYALLYMQKHSNPIWLLDNCDQYLALSEIEPWLNELLTVCEEKNGQVLLTSNNLRTITTLGDDHGLQLLPGDNGSPQTTVNKTKHNVHQTGLIAPRLIGRG